MSVIAPIISEFKAESAATRKALERVHDSGFSFWRS